MTLLFSSANMTKVMVAFFILISKLIFMAQMSSNLRKGSSVYEKCEVTFSKKIALPYQESFLNDRT